MIVKKLKKVFYILCCLVLFGINPIYISALENSREQNITSSTDSINKTDFIYNFNLKETFDILYEKKSIEECIKKYIESKVGNEYEVTVDQENKEFKITKDNQIYNGNFAYTLQKNMIVNLVNNDKLTSIKNYINENTNITDDFNVKNISEDTYAIKIGNIEKEFNITFTLNNNDRNNENSNSIHSDENIEKTPRNSTPTVIYSTHVQNIGWQEWKNNGELSGTEGEWLRLEAIKIKVDNQGINGNIEYQTHVENIGWQEWKNNGELSGTEGEWLRLEAIKIRLTGELANQYDLYYTVHVQNIGWMGWAKNGESSGSAGYGYRLEAIKIKIVPKGTNFDRGTITPYDEHRPLIYSNSYVQTRGWLGQYTDSEVVGTVGYGLRLEALKLSLYTYGISGGLEYSTHIQNIGWQDYKKDGEVSGVEGQNLRIEAIKIKLTGDILNEYDLYYRAHVANVGWLGWTTSDQEAGTSGFYRQMEAIEIKLVKKGEAAPDTSQDAYLEKGVNIKYSTHVSYIGWQDYVQDGMTAGTEGQALGIEAMKVEIDGNNTISGNVHYQTYIHKKGWQDYKENGQVAGKMGEYKYIEAIRIKLSGNISNFYNVYYRVHVSNVGWLGWASNGQEAGTGDIDQQIEAIEIRLVATTDQPPTSTQSRYLIGKWDATHTHYYNAWGQMANDFKIIDGVKYFFNTPGELIGSNVRKVIDVSSHQKDINWEVVKQTDDIDAVILRVAAGSLHEDSKLARNVEALNRLKIPYGIYLYSYAEDIEGSVPDLGKMHEGALEAQRIIKAINTYNMKLDLPIYYDLEKWDTNNRNHLWTVNNYKPIIAAFNKQMTNAGYDWKIYTGTHWANTALNDPDIRSKIDWIAEYNHHCKYQGNYSGWQFSSTESIAGIEGGVDTSVWFK